MRVAVRRAGVLLDAGSGTLVNASRVDLPTWTALELRILSEFSVFRMCFPFPGISPIPSMLHGPVTVSAPGARIRIGRVRRKHMIYSVCRFSTDPFAKKKNHECHADPQPSPNRQSSACDMVHAHLTRTHKFQDSTKLTSERLLRLRRARTSSPRMTDGKNGGLGVVNLYT